MKKLFFVLILLIGAFIAGVWFQRISHSHAPVMSKAVFVDKEKSQIVDTLTGQSAAWSSGDIDAFMDDYWKSDDLRFASGGTVKRGWQTTSDRYKARYPDKAAMGVLSFTELEVELLSAEHALVFGRWTLTREGDTPTGLFTLHMEKQNEAWKIVSDHTSSGAP